MANTTSAKKMVRKIARRTVVNKARRSRVRTYVKKVETAITAGDQTAAKAALVTAESEMMRAVGKGVFHKNTGSRKVSRLSARVKAMSA
jgi:small subunit ribosomal protein S20